jgi:hypothetical protein
MKAPHRSRGAGVFNAAFGWDNGAGSGGLKLNEDLETDCLVVGGGGAAMAFTDAAT